MWIESPFFYSSAIYILLDIKCYDYYQVFHDKLLTIHPYTQINIKTLESW